MEANKTELIEIRNKFYDSLPTGDIVSAYDVICRTKDHLKRLDAFIDKMSTKTEANKTKEEILSKCDGILASVKAYPEDEVLSAMDEYANQLLLEKDRENELLKIDLEIEKKKVLLNYESAISFEKQVKQLQSELQNALRELEAKKSVCNQFTEHIKHLESELSELKEKRKEEIIRFAEWLSYNDFVTNNEGFWLQVGLEREPMTTEEVCNYYAQTYGQ